MMASEFALDGDGWPTLPISKASTPVAGRSDDWEILDDSNELDAHPLESKESTTLCSTREAADFELAHDYNAWALPKHQEKSATPNKKVLRHSLSSPILTGSCGKDILVTSSDYPPLPGVIEQDGLDDGFTLVSDVPSLWTTSSTATSAKTVSFRDAILLSPSTAPNGQVSPRLQAMSITGVSQETPRQRSRIQPQFVVVQSPPNRIRRCSKSTGNLLEMNVTSLLDDADSERTGLSVADSDLYRCFDEEFYFRKALGSASRINGLKLRPDEAKRRLMILNKKDQQRRAASSGTIMKSTVKNK
jgi:hypothetical protein